MPKRLPVLPASLRSVPYLRTGAALAGVVAVCGLLGTLRGLDHDRLLFLPLGSFSFDGERNVIAILSTIGLLAAATLAWHARDRSKAFAGLAALFAFMAADELLVLHEHLEGAVRIDWQMLYAPVGLAAAALWWMGLRALPARGLRVAWIAAAAAWAFAQMFEFLQYGEGDELTRGWVSLPEETLEMAGTCLFVLTLAALADRRRADPGSGAAAGERLTPRSWRSRRSPRPPRGTPRSGPGPRRRTARAARSRPR